MSGYVVTWTIYTESEGDYKVAAQEVAQRFFKERIAEGEPESARVSGHGDGRKVRES